MSVEYVVGDLFTTDAEMIVHGCNCKGVMGSGVAKIIRNKFPRAYEAYDELSRLRGLELGTVQFVEISDGDYPLKIIANCMTQDNFGSHKRMGDYEAIYNCYEKLRDFAIDNNIHHIATCKIGCGLAGCEWSIVQSMIENIYTNEYDVKITVYSID